MTEVVKCT